MPLTKSLKDTKSRFPSFSAMPSESKAVAAAQSESVVGLVPSPVPGRISANGTFTRWDGFLAFCSQAEASSDRPRAEASRARLLQAAGASGLRSVKMRARYRALYR